MPVEQILRPCRWLPREGSIAGDGRQVDGHSQISERAVGAVIMVAPTHAHALRSARKACREIAMRLAKHLDLPVDVVDLLKPGTGVGVASPKVRMPAELVSTLLQRSQEGLVGSHDPPIFAVHLPYLSIGPQQPGEDRRPSCAVRNSAQ